MYTVSGAALPPVILSGGHVTMPRLLTVRNTGLRVWGGCQGVLAL